MPADFDLLAQFVDLGLLRVVLAQLALDGLQLLAQDVLALGLVHLRLDFGLDATLQLEDLDLAAKEGGDELQPLDDVDRLEQLLALLGGHVRAVGDHVGQESGLADVACRDRSLRRDRSAVGDILLDLGLHAAHEGLDLEAARAVVSQFLDRRPQIRTRARQAVHAHARLALDDRPDGAVLELHDLRDLGEGADLVELGRVVDLFLLGLSLGDEDDGSPIRDRRIERVDALLSADLERDDHLGKDDGLPKGDERQLSRSGGGRLLFDRGGRSLGHQGSPTLLGLRSGRAWWMGSVRTPLRRESPPHRGPRGSGRRGAPRARTGSGCRRG